MNIEIGLLGNIKKKIVVVKANSGDNKSKQRPDD